MEIITWNHIIISIRWEYLNLYSCVQINSIRDITNFMPKNS